MRIGAVNVQKNKPLEKDVQTLHEIAEKNAKHYEKDVRHLKAPISQEGLAEAQTIIYDHPSSHPNRGSCKGKCSSFQPTSDMEPSLQVCMSFSVPIQVWKDLNEDLIRHQAYSVKMRCNPLNTNFALMELQR